MHRSLLVKAPIMDYFAFMEYVVLELFEHALLLTFEATYLLSYSRTQSFKNYQNLFELLVKKSDKKIF